ncbi:MAG: Do family serine endopeptidase [Deltaproteobacteria bacterium]|nr:Do family serine endopeptidase [Deltaproteobacteria bacterium]
MADSLKIPKAVSIAPPTSFSDLAEKVGPSVVNIATTKEIATRRLTPWGSDPFFRDFFGQAPPATSKKRTLNSLGTGFIINEKGDILTNNHVIEGADEIVVTLADGREIEATVVGRDKRLDIAVIRPKEEGSYPYSPLGDSDALKVGDWVVAIGNPFGLGHTVTAGIVSAKARVLGAGPYDDFIQTDASINPGNSGGPLFNTQGEVVGINTAIIQAGQGLGFAIPVNMAKEVIPQLISKGAVSRGWMGVAIGDLDSDEAKRMGIDASEGAYVAEAVAGGPAEKAGIRAGDVIVEFNGQAVKSSHSLPTMVAKLQPGAEANVVFLHEGKKYERSVTLGSLDQPQTTVAQGSQKVGEGLGVSVRDLTASEKQRVQGGVVVESVEEGSFAESIGIREGDLLLELNGQPIDDLKDFKKRMGEITKGGVIRLGLARGPSIYYFAFRKE